MYRNKIRNCQGRRVISRPGPVGRLGQAVLGLPAGHRGDAGSGRGGEHEAGASAQLHGPDRYDQPHGRPVRDGARDDLCVPGDRHRWLDAQGIGFGPRYFDGPVHDTDRSGYRDPGDCGVQYLEEPRLPLGLGSRHPEREPDESLRERGRPEVAADGSAVEFGPVHQVGTVAVERLFATGKTSVECVSQNEDQEAGIRGYRGRSDAHDRYDVSVDRFLHGADQLYSERAKRADSIAGQRVGKAPG